MLPSLVLGCCALACGWSSPDAAAPGSPTLIVECEEDVYHVRPADNGAGPMWCSGSTCLVRVRDAVVVSGLETIEQAIPLNNCRWRLFHRSDEGWQTVAVDPDGRTREPSPLVAFADGSLFMSANPTLAPPDARSGPARPEILRWHLDDLSQPWEVYLPRWRGTPGFTEHSYRSFAADGPRGELILFQNVDYTHAEWAFRDARGIWQASGQLQWPWGAEYDQPQPIRICYPNVMLHNRAVHFCGVSDIVEPYAKWRAAKKELTGRDWDFDFRRLFYTWSDDIAGGQFHEWVEIASRDETCGWISPCDLWIAPDGRVHLLWTERALDLRLRDRFFPGLRQSDALHHAIVDRGRVVHRQTLVLAEEGGAAEIASAARFHITADGRQWVIYYVSGTGSDGQAVSENRLVELRSDGSVGEPIRVPLQRPFTSYFTATIRAGSLPSDLLDLLGHTAGRGATLSYARVRIE